MTKHLTLLTAILCASSAVNAQQRRGNGGGGGVDAVAGVSYSYEYATYPDSNNAKDLQALVLYRGQPYWAVVNWEHPDTVDRGPALRRLVDSLGKLGWSTSVGSVLNHPYASAIDNDRKRLWVEGSFFDLVADSALVVFVDRADEIGGPPRVIGTVRIDPRRVNAAWNSAHPKGANEGVLDSAGASAPAIKAFLAAARPATCASLDNVFLYWQADARARFIPGAAKGLAPRPIPEKSKPGAPDLIAQFVVDTAGKVEMSSLTSLSPVPITEAVTEAARAWRFKPAVANGCVVRSLEQVVVK